jgi:polysaccharide pyruvyl transferase WcaK-like protein
VNRVGIITNIDANHGSCIFNASVCNLIQKMNPDSDVHIIDYLNPRWRLIELVRSLKLNKNIPFYNLQRSITLARFVRNEVPSESLLSFRNYEQLCKELDSRHYSTLITGKVVWDISNDSPTKFPNVYWFSEKMLTQKIAYAVSGHRTNLDIFKEYKKRVFEILASYQLIGVRDDMTQIMMEEAGVDKVVPVYRISDPAFLYNPKPIEPQELLSKFKIPPDQPILGLLYYGKEKISHKICEHYHNKGYLIINFNMYNPYADVNIGHRVNPDEWAAFFKQLTFCITDRFHGSVFCLRNDIPFVAIEPYQPKTLLNSKIFSLLKDFGIENICYQNTYLPEFDLDHFLSTCDQVEFNWKRGLSVGVRSRLLAQNQSQRDFLKLVKKQIELSHPAE